MGMEVHACDLSIQQVEAGGSGVPADPDYTESVRLV